MKPPRAPSAGFTLIEVMVAGVVLAILVTLAWPTYREQVARGRRSDAQAALYESAQYMQRYYAANNGYTGGPPAPQLPFAVSPRNGAKAYDLVIADATAITYQLNAAPAPGGPMAGDKCGVFTLMQDGTRGLSGNAPGTSVETCWR